MLFLSFSASLPTSFLLSSLSFLPPSLTSYSLLHLFSFSLVKKFNTSFPSTLTSTSSLPPHPPPLPSSQVRQLSSSLSPSYPQLTTSQVKQSSSSLSFPPAHLLPGEAGELHPFPIPAHLLPGEVSQLVHSAVLVAEVAVPRRLHHLKVDVGVFVEGMGDVEDLRVDGHGKALLHGEVVSMEGDEAWHDVHRHLQVFHTGEAVAHVCPEDVTALEGPEPNVGRTVSESREPNACAT